MPKISIIVPVYNIERYLRECLDSIIKQTLYDIEIICVDDGSTDASPRILADYAERDNRITVITKRNSGYGHTMNVGLEAAHGEYVAIVESDDYIDESMFFDLYSVAKKNNLDVVKSDFYEFTSSKIEDEKYVMTPTSKKYYNKVLSSVTDPVIFDFILNTWTGIYKREFLLEYGIRHNETPGASYQDNGFFFQTVALAPRIMFINGAYYHYRQDNPNSSINNRKKVFCICEEYDFIRKFVDKYQEYRPDLLPIYHARKFHNYFYSYRRIASEHKLLFLERFKDEFSLSYARSEFDARFLDKESYQTLMSILKDYKSFYYKDNTRYLEGRVLTLGKEINAINSKYKTKEYRPKEIRLLTMSKNSTYEARDRYIDHLEKKMLDLSSELASLKALPEYKTIYAEIKKENTLFKKAMATLREKGLAYTIQKTINKLRER